MVDGADDCRAATGAATGLAASDSTSARGRMAKNAMTPATATAPTYIGQRDFECEEHSASAGSNSGSTSGSGAMLKSSIGGGTSSDISGICHATGGSRLGSDATATATDSGRTSSATGALMTGTRTGSGTMSATGATGIGSGAFGATDSGRGFACIAGHETGDGIGVGARTGREGCGISTSSMGKPAVAGSMRLGRTGSGAGTSAVGDWATNSTTWFCRSSAGTADPEGRGAGAGAGADDRWGGVQRDVGRVSGVVAGDAAMSVRTSRRAGWAGAGAGIGADADDGCGIEPARSLASLKCG